MVEETNRTEEEIQQEAAQAENPQPEACENADEAAARAETVPGETGAAGAEDVQAETEKAGQTSDIPKEASPAEQLAALTEAVSALSGKMEEMNTLFIKKIQHTAHEEQIVDKMHAELQRYKEDMYAQLVRPILLDIIEMRNSILRMARVYEAKPEGEQNIPLKTFRDYSYDIQDILEKNNISIYESKEGDSFSPAKQRVLKKLETPAEELHGRIAESLSPGYDYLGKTIAPEKVAVYIYKDSEDAKGENE